MKNIYFINLFSPRVALGIILPFEDSNDTGTGNKVFGEKLTKHFVWWGGGIFLIL